MSVRPRLHVILTFLISLSCLLLAAYSEESCQGQARQILDATGVRGGLIVHLSCGDGRLTAALCASDRYVVHGLDRDPENIAAARKRIQALGQYGDVFVERWSGDQLPYIDNMVNLVVSEPVPVAGRAALLAAARPHVECQCGRISERASLLHL